MDINVKILDPRMKDRVVRRVRELLTLYSSEFKLRAAEIDSMQALQALISQFEAMGNVEPIVVAIDEETATRIGIHVSNFRETIRFESRRKMQEIHLDTIRARGRH